MFYVYPQVYKDLILVQVKNCAEIDIIPQKCSVLAGDQGKIASTFEFTWQYGHEIEFAKALQPD